MIRPHAHLAGAVTVRPACYRSAFVVTSASESEAFECAYSIVLIVRWKHRWAAMTITHTKDTGCRHEWECHLGGRKYCVSYHYLNDSWSVQLCRQDGEHEILSAAEASAVLQEFPTEGALALAKADTRAAEPRDAVNSSRRGIRSTTMGAPSESAQG